MNFHTNDISSRNHTRRIASLAVMLSMGILLSCNDFLETSVPSKQLPIQYVFESDATATAATVGIYEQIMENFNSAFNSQMTLSMGLASDELLNTTGNAFQEEFFTNSINPAGDQLKQYFWNTCYKYVYQSNAILEGLAKSSGVTQAVSDQLAGEARFMRAFSYFYLTNLFGDVPLTTSTDYRQNTSTTRASVADVYASIITDLQAAQGLLGDTYVTAGKIRPNKMVATAFLARAYLYQKDWPNAEKESGKVISNPAYALLADLNTVFLANSREVIWQMIPIISGMNTAEGNRFALTNAVPVYAELSASVLSAFPAGDKRRTAWVSQFVVSGRSYATPFKYKIRTGATVTEYYSVLRLSEQYLIRSEARANQGNLAGAISDLDAVRSRAGLSLLQNTNPGISQANLLLAIERERQNELFCEWGHRWFDLKRTGRIDAVMTASKPATWKSKVLLPIPASEILINSKLTQNPGY